MVKYSRQREGILKNLQSRRDHPTADMVYESVRREYPSLSLRTVYRNLSLLAENGQILKISTGIGPDHFDGYVEPHYHFICRECGAVLDLDYLPGEHMISEASGRFAGRIDGYELKFFGKCEICLSK